MENIFAALRKKYGDNLMAISKDCEEKLLTDGFVYSIYGWEKPATLEKYGLSQFDLEIPSCLIDEYEEKERASSVKDVWGKATGEKTIERYRVMTGRRVLSPTQGYLDYVDYLKRKADAEKFDEKNLIDLERLSF